MRALWLPLLMAAAPAAALAFQPALHDRTLEAMPTGDSAVVLRYLAPEIAGLPYTAVADTLDTLCEIDGLEAWAATTPRPDEIVIVLMDRPVPRGQADPEATQYISAYRAEGGERCIWQ